MKTKQPKELINADKRKKDKIKKYIALKALKDEDLQKGITTKKELMLQAGYTLESASKNNLENTKLYAELSNEIINKTGFVLDRLINAIEEKVRNDVHLSYSLPDLIKQLNTIVTVYKGLSPTFKQKKTVINDDGSKEITWKQLN